MYIAILLLVISWMNYMVKLGHLNEDDMENVVGNDAWCTLCCPRYEVRSTSF